MGTSQSTPANPAQHVFSSDTPVQFSQELIDSLQASSETNSTRAKTLELHIQQRVAAELAKLQADTAERVAAAKAKAKAEAEAAVVDNNNNNNNNNNVKTPTTTTTTSTQAVQGSIEALRRELEARRRVRELPRELERAREDVVACLRVNDRRPLDCWKEVERFKREVRRLEEEFVGGVL